MKGEQQGVTRLARVQPQLAGMQDWMDLPPIMRSQQREFSAAEAHGFFLAVLCAPEVRGRFQELGARVQRTHRLTGKLRPKGLLHATLFSFGRYDGPDEKVDRLIDFVRIISGGFFYPCFDVRFDRVMGFGRGNKNKAIVAVGGAGVSPLIEFQQSLGRELEAAGLPAPAAGHFKPHVTLLYDRRAVPEQAAEPIAWTVREFALIHSNIGRSRYDVLGKWPLLEGAAAARGVA